MSCPLHRKSDIINSRSYQICLVNHKDNEFAAFIIISGLKHQRYSGISRKLFAKQVRISHMVRRKGDYR